MATGGTADPFAFEWLCAHLTRSFWKSAQRGSRYKDCDEDGCVLVDPLARVVVANRQTEPKKIIHPLLRAKRVAVGARCGHIEAHLEQVARAVDRIAIVGITAHECDYSRSHGGVAKVTGERHRRQVGRVVAAARRAGGAALESERSAATRVTHNLARLHRRLEWKHLVGALCRHDGNDERRVVRPLSDAFRTEIAREDEQLVS
eukprot:7205945-Prymnesium_polylepis.1